jgi:hypothetical protein
MKLALLCFLHSNSINSFGLWLDCEGEGLVFRLFQKRMSMISLLSAPVRTNVSLLILSEQNSCTLITTQYDERLIILLPQFDGAI